MDLFSELSAQMIKYRFKPNPRMAQFFIVDEELLEELIAMAELSKKDVVLDIGAGTGNISKELAKKCKKVIASEIDSTLCKLLKENLPKNAELIEGNFLGKEWKGFNKAVSYPPQNICGDIIIELMMHEFDQALLVLRDDFSERLVSEPGFADYSAITVLLQYLCKAEIKKRKISPKAFFPKPNSFHSIILLERKKMKAEFDIYQFSLFLKYLFRYRNKNLSNALEKVCKEFSKDLGIDVKKAEKELSNEEFASKKLNLLTVEEFAALFSRISRG